ncbi:MAG: phospholipase D-like domain-containing protein [Pseudomonadota bacterium]
MRHAVMLALPLLALLPLPAFAEGSLTLVETAPEETTLQHADLPDAWQVWPELIAAAQGRLDIGEFYVSDEPGQRLEPVLAAIRKAAKRGVQVRILADKGFHDRTYPEPLDSLAKVKNVEVRLYDLEALVGGVQHAKYFIVDGREAYFGSQNFDWRSLTHVQELGVRTDQPAIVRALGDVFEADWALAGGTPVVQALAVPEPPYGFPVEVAFGDAQVQATFVASPNGLLPAAGTWDLPALVELIDSAHQRVRVQLLTYATTDREGRYFDELEDALRRAAARKVEVELLMADWAKRKWMIEGLQSLECLPNVTVKLVTIPEHSSGYIPFARVVHAKYLVVDGERAWVGTSNWGYDYFHESRNVGLVVEGPPFAARLDAFFQDLWDSPYAVEVDPSAHYEPPKRN